MSIRASAAQFRRRYALKLDASGVHYPGLPLLPWTHVTGLALELNTLRWLMDSSLTMR